MKNSDSLSNRIEYNRTLERAIFNYRPTTLNSSNGSVTIFYFRSGHLTPFFAGPCRQGDVGMAAALE